MDLRIKQPVSILFRGLSKLPGSELDYEYHLLSALDWIEAASEAAEGQGISKGYDLVTQRWAPAYPETSGYSIPTLLNAAHRLNKPRYADLARRIADWLLTMTHPEGGVTHWMNKEEPIVFDTGQVMFGWLAVFELTGDEKYLQATKRAAEWLIKIQEPEGFWKKGQYLGVVKTIDTRVAWALLKLYIHDPQEKWLHSAILQCEWALKQQNADGWFRNCSFTEQEDPYTHTIAYTAEGLLESGLFVQDQRYIDAARLTAITMAKILQPAGRLSSTYARGWKPTSRSCCLTGCCQAGLIWLRLFKMDSDQLYLSAAQRVIKFVAQTQITIDKPAPIRGAIAGSYPIVGRYERLKYPNWATKFFIDALLRLEQIMCGVDAAEYVG